MIQPTLQEACRLARGARAVPVFCRLLGDSLTPVAAFARLARHANYAFLLESVGGGEKIGRYSFVGARPRRVVRAAGAETCILDARGGVQNRSSGDHPFARLESELNSFGPVAKPPAVFGLPGLPRFIGGAVGYAAYDAVRYNERLPAPPPDDRRLPDLEFGLYDTMTIFDHVSKTILVVSLADVGAGAARRAYAAARERIEGVISVLRRAGEGGVVALPAASPRESRFVSNVTRSRFEESVRRAKEYVRAGDIFQVVLSQRLRVRTEADPFDVYRALRVINPSPFMFFLKGPSCTLIGASPEILCRVEEGVVTSRPLAGTRRRGRTDEEDRSLESELRADPKDRAEHVMLVDLGRNDVGRVCEAGSVELSELMVVERYSHVMHLSSNVRGRLAAGMTAFDALRATLPVGTVSGAPKVRAMQIIDELEPTRRGPYGGAVGYFDFSGNMDTCIALRTMVVMPDAARPPRGKKKHRPARRRKARNVVDIQAGAGIVADSEPAAEHEETLNKARALLAAVSLAEQMFPSASGRRRASRTARRKRTRRAP